MAEISRFEGYDIFKYKFATKFVLNKRVLDIGCGFGNGTRLLAESNAREVIGIDYSEAALNEARKKKNPNLSFIQRDIQNLGPFKDNFDTVVFFEVIEHLSSMEQKEILKNIDKILNNKGCLIITTNNKALSSYNPYHKNELTAIEFRELIGNFFDAEFFGIKHKYPAEFKKEGFKNKFINFICRPKIIQTYLITLFPKQLREFINSKFLKLTPMTEGDFKIQVDLDNCESFLAICKKR